MIGKETEERGGRSERGNAGNEQPWGVMARADPCVIWSLSGGMPRVRIETHENAKSDDEGGEPRKGEKRASEAENGPEAPRGVGAMERRPAVAEQASQSEKNYA